MVHKNKVPVTIKGLSFAFAVECRDMKMSCANKKLSTTTNKTLCLSPFPPAKMAKVLGPKFLVNIENFMNDELISSENDPSLNRFSRAEKRLNIAREVFQKIASELKTFGGLLNKIQCEYDHYLSEIRRDLKYSEKERKRYSNFIY